MRTITQLFDAEFRIIRHAEVILENETRRSIAEELTHKRKIKKELQKQERAKDRIERERLKQKRLAEEAIAREAKAAAKKARFLADEIRRQEREARKMTGISDDCLRMPRKKPRKSPAEQRHQAYSDRNKIIKTMGFASYSSYLNSELWTSIRKQVLAKFPTCYVCEKAAIQVHHLSYRKQDMDGSDLSKLVALCAGCHFKIEFRRHDGEKLSPKQAKGKMKFLRTMHLKYNPPK
jgi:hypothetical protein